MPNIIWPTTIMLGGGGGHTPLTFSLGDNLPPPFPTPLFCQCNFFFFREEGRRKEYLKTSGWSHVGTGEVEHYLGQHACLQTHPSCEKVRPAALIDDVGLAY